MAKDGGIITIKVRVKEMDKVAFDQAAAAVGMPTSTWMRQAVLERIADLRAQGKIK